VPVGDFFSARSGRPWPAASRSPSASCRSSGRRST
jgi:hypothetical protein